MEYRDRRNIGLNAAGESIWGFQCSLVATATVITVLLKQYGAGAVMIGALMGLESGLYAFPQIFGLYIFSSVKNRKKQLIIWHLAAIVPLMALMGVIVLSAGGGPGLFGRWGLLISFALRALSMGIVIGAWLDWVARVFDRNVRGRAMGIAMFASAAAGVMGSLTSGWFIQRFPGNTIYGVLLLASAVLAAASASVFVFVDDRLETMKEDAKTARDVRTLVRRFRESVSDGNFRAFLIGRIMASLGFCMVPFIAIFYGSIQGGGLSAGVIVSCGAASTVGTALANIILGRIGDRHGHRLGVIAGAAAQVAALVFLLVCPGRIGCIATYFFGGVCFGSVLVSHANMMFETCPHDHRLAHITASSLLFSVPSMAAPMLGGFVAGEWGVRVLFVSCLFLSIVALVWFVVMVKEPRLLRVYIREDAVWEDHDER